MTNLLARIRALPDTLQNLVVLGTLVSVIVIVALIFTVFA